MITAQRRSDSDTSKATAVRNFTKNNLVGFAVT